jgi:hypothetical protein
MKKKTTPKTTRSKTKQPPTPVCENETIGETEFHVYYSTSDGGEWELDETYTTLAEAEAYCREKSEAYTEDIESGEDDPTSWEFFIYEVKAVRAFRCRFKVEITIEES